jgi:hypothetical protein
VQPLYIGESQSGRFSEDVSWSAALALGMSEVHAHLLAADAVERAAIEIDLRWRHWTPLHAQSPWTTAVRPSIGSG